MNTYWFLGEGSGATDLGAVISAWYLDDSSHHVSWVTRMGTAPVNQDW